MGISPGKLLVGWRERKSLKTWDLAEKLGITQASLLSLEKDEDLPETALVVSLAEALGLSSEELEEFKTAIRSRRDTTLSESEPRRASPYVGMISFTEADSSMFFGRERETELVLNKLDFSGFVAIVGSSGSGKSSLVAAGVIPALRKVRDLTVVRFVPDRNPFVLLAVALMKARSSPAIADSLPEDPNDLARRLEEGGSVFLESEVVADNDQGPQLVVFIDQLEEVFTQTDETARESFLRWLKECSSALEGGSATVNFLLTIRGDFFPRIIENPKLAPRFQDNDLLLSQISEEGLRAAIEGPAVRAGHPVDPELVNLILVEAGDTPGILPLLQFCLSHAWDPEQGITMERYEEIGGLHGAIATLADKVHQSLSPEGRDHLRAVMLDLVRVGLPDVGEVDTRVRARLRDIQSHDPNGNVLNRLLKARLVVIDNDEQLGSTVEIAHEALLEHWPRLQGWIAEDREVLVNFQRLRCQLQDWTASPDFEKDSMLIRGARLENAEILVSSYPQYSSPELEDFVRRSTELAQQESFAIARDQLERIAGMSPDDASDAIPQLRRFLGQLMPRVTELIEQGTPGQRRRLHWLLAPTSAASLTSLLETMAALGPFEVRAIVEDFEHQDGLPSQIDEILLAEIKDDGDPAWLLRATSLLSQLRGKVSLTSEQWNLVVDTLVHQNALELREWTKLLSPVRSDIYPLLRWFLADEAASERLRSNAASIIGELFANDPAPLADLVAMCPESNFSNALALINRLTQLRGDVIVKLGEIARETPASVASDIERRVGGRRRASARLALMQLDPSAGYVDDVDASEDPEASTQFLARSGEIDANQLARLFWACSPPSSNLVLALGDHSLGDYADGNSIVGAICDLYRTSEAPVMLSAIVWLLTVWGHRELAMELLAEDVADSVADWIGNVGESAKTTVPISQSSRRKWFCLRIGDSLLPFAVVPPGDLLMGSHMSYERTRPDEAPEHEVSIRRNLAVAVREITRTEYGSFLDDVNMEGLPDISEWSPTLNCPAVGVTWNEAMTFSRWLVGGSSWSEGDAIDLSAGLLRLPTEAEWEHAARGGTKTLFSFGSDPKMLSRYGWVDENAHLRTHSAYQLRPNPNGLFNVHGNTWEWCLDYYNHYRSTADPSVDPLADEKSPWRVLRGGCWNLGWWYARSAQRNRHLPTNRNWYIGFRLVVTLPPDVDG